MVKIVYCIPAASAMGGLERILCNKTSWLCNNGYDVTIVTTGQNQEKPFFSFDERIHFYDLGVNYYRNYSRRLPIKAIMFVFNHVKHRVKLTRLLNEIRPDITVSMFFHEMSFLTKLKDGSKKVLEFHFCKENPEFAHNHVDYKHIRKFDEFVVLTEQDREAWVNSGINNIQVIPNMIDKIPNQRAALDNHIVIAVGRLVKIKAFHRLIEVWDMLKSDLGDWQLHIWGDGTLKEELQQDINDRGLQKSILLKGATIDINKEYQSSSVFVATSIAEGFHLGIIEAESYGIPVVSYTFPCGPKDIIKNGEDGFIVQDGDRDGLARSLYYLMSNSEVRKEMGHKAYVNAHNYAPDIIMAKWDSLFKSLLKVE